MERTRRLVRRKAVSVLAAILVVAGFLVWEFGVKASQAKKQVWQGTVAARERKRDWLSGFRKPNRPTYRYYDYYLSINCADGRRIRVEVPHTLYNEAEVGDPILKVRGRR
jgi:hypothetical protein